MTIRKLMIQSEIYLTAFLALGTDGLREEISRALEGKRGLRRD